MSVSKKDVEKTAFTARLEFSDEELEALTSHLGAVLEYAQELDGLDTEGVKPTSSVLKDTNAFREDVVRPSLAIERVMAGAPEHEGNYFKVPKILE